MPGVNLVGFVSSTTGFVGVVYQALFDPLGNLIVKPESVERVFNQNIVILGQRIQKALE